ncbi:helix-turn-helix transcriptional regulator [Amycolatopsis mediterranei]|uniref:helix-turn-helix domain-containing protein n=1 Tax=Amycolatopsis mediterranei TaxID=33910 RepID=UPI0034425D24
MAGRNNFGELLRGWRDRLSPAEVGLSVTGPRRVRGLRREELAGMAGVSADYLRRLEQGQGRPSRAVLDALAGAGLGADRRPGNRPAARDQQADPRRRSPRRGRRRPLIPSPNGVPAAPLDLPPTWSTAWTAAGRHGAARDEPFVGRAAEHGVGRPADCRLLALICPRHHSRSRLTAESTRTSTTE